MLSILFLNPLNCFCYCHGHTDNRREDFVFVIREQIDSANYDQLLLVTRFKNTCKPLSRWRISKSIIKYVSNVFAIEVAVTTYVFIQLLILKRAKPVLQSFYYFRFYFLRLGRVSNSDLTLQRCII